MPEPKPDFKKLCWSIRGQKGTPESMIEAFDKRTDIPQAAKEQIIASIQAGHLGSQLINIDVHWNVFQNPDKRIHTVANIHICDL